MDPKPMFNSTVLVVAAIYGVVLRIALAARLFGFLLAFMITLSLFRFAYHALREVAMGRSYITPPDLESTNPVGELSFALHGALFTLSPIMFALMPRIIGEGMAAESIRAIGLIVVLGAFPASVAVMSMTRNIGVALNPVAIGSVIRVLRFDYVVLLAWCCAVAAAAALVSTLLGGGLGIVDGIIGVWGFLALFALVGSAIRAHSADFDFRDVDDVRAQHAIDDRHREWHRALDQAYASIRSGFVEQGYNTIKRLIASEGDSLDVYHWVFNRMLDWQEQKFALDLAKRFVVRLVEEKRERDALDLIVQCRRLSPTFEVPPEVAGPVSAYARAIGRPRLAEDLAAAAQPERPGGASGVSPRAPSP
jgi:hypothetical protein